MRLDFWRMAKKMNGVDSKTAKAVGKVVEAMEHLNHSNNELVAIGKECDDRIEHYTKVTESSKSKMDTNNKIIDVLKNIVE